MYSQVYKATMDYAVDVVKATKESGCEMDEPLEQFVEASLRIGAELARVEIAVEQEDLLETYKEAGRSAYRSIYLGDILGQLEDYSAIPFKTLRQQCEQLYEMLTTLMDNVSNNEK